MMQGGYVASLAAGDRMGPIRVQIRRPLSPGDELRLDEVDDRWDVYRADDLVLRGQPSPMHVDDPGPPDNEAIAAAMQRPLPFPLPFASCSGCGERDDALGFKIRPLSTSGQMVAEWTPQRRDAASDGNTPRAHVWTVIDCITSWCVFSDPPPSGSGQAVTGNIAMDFRSELSAGEPYYFQSWRVDDDDRRIVCGGSVHDADGQLVALADQELFRTDGWGMEIPEAPLV